MLVEFIHRLTKPELPDSGSFYWIYGNGNQIWFAPDRNPDNMILLNDTFEGLEERLEEFEARIEKTEGDIEVIKVELDGLEENLKNELREFIDDYLKKNLKTVNGELLYGGGNIEIKTEVVIDNETKNEIIEQVKKEVETRLLEWTVIE